MFHFPRYCYKIGLQGLLGCPIRKPPDQSLSPTPRGISLVSASFIASLCQGIHHLHFTIYLIYLQEHLISHCDITKIKTRLNFQRTGIFLLQEVDPSGIEPLTSRMQIWRSPNWAKGPTLDWYVDPSGLEPPASRLSGVCSNQLSYRS